MATKKKTAKKSAATKSSARTPGTRKKTSAKKASAKKTSAKKASAKKTAAKKITGGVRGQWEVRVSPIQGRGVFAARKIEEDEKIGEYIGEIITEKEADLRYPFEGEERHHTFLFRLDNGKIIDAEHGGNAMRFINHSCDPNCEAEEEDGRIFIYAARDIRRGEELAYDYNFILEERHTAKQKALYPCYCGAKNCRGTILASKR